MGFKAGEFYREKGLSWPSYFRRWGPSDVPSMSHEPRLYWVCSIATSDIGMQPA